MRSLAVLLFLVAALAVQPDSIAAGKVSRNEVFVMTGTIDGIRLAGIEPDGDPLYQAVIQSKLTGVRSLPTISLVIDTYLENFKPDTTPLLPDLLHPTKTASNLGGFLQGKALLTDDRGDAVSIGSFIAEAFLNNSNHAVTRFAGAAHGSLRGIFWLRKDGKVTGSMLGQIALTSAARAQIIARRGAKMKPIKDVISAVTVQPHAMMGRNPSHSSTVPLHTGFGQTPRKTISPSTPRSSRKINPWTIVSGIGAVASLVIAALLVWSERRRKTEPTPPPPGP